MMEHFWTIVILVKLILFSLLIYYINATRNSINVIDPAGIKSNFKVVEYLSYTLLIFVYTLFTAKLLIPKKNEHSGICGVNMALLLVLITCVRQTRNALNIADKGPIPITFIDSNFQLTENLGYLTSIFNILTIGLVFVGKTDMLPKLNLSPSPKSLSGKML